MMVGHYRIGWEFLRTREAGDVVREGEYGEDGRDTKLSQSREHESLDSNQGVIMEARLALEIHEQNITVQNLALDS